MNKPNVTSNWHQHQTVENKDQVPKIDKAQIIQATLEQAEKKVKLVESKKVPYPEELTDLFKTLGQHAGIPGPKGVRALRAKRNHKEKLRRQHARGR